MKKNNTSSWGNVIIGVAGSNHIVKLAPTFYKPILRDCFTGESITIDLDEFRLVDSEKFLDETLEDEFDAPKLNETSELDIWTQFLSGSTLLLFTQYKEEGARAFKRLTTKEVLKLGKMFGFKEIISLDKYLPDVGRILCNDPSYLVEVACSLQRFKFIGALEKFSRASRDLNQSLSLLLG